MREIHILIIDDEADVCTFFRRLLGRKGYKITTATSEAEALQALAATRFNVALVDLKLPDTDGLTLLQAIKTRQPSCEVIIMTGYSTVKTAVAAMQQGAYEYLEKPFDDIREIETLIAKASDRGLSLQQGLPTSEEWSDVAQAVGLLVGTSPQMLRLVSLAHKVAGKHINVLIQGKTGTGKEVLSRFIHADSPRADAPFIAVNCGALPENLLESELFGHERGAFTGASQTRRGIFELANHGTLLLDEIGDASPMIQVKLLRILETGEFMRVGGERPIKTDVRVIAATNVDLEEAIREKTFREDLYYRLNVVRLEIPTLHERSEDIPRLAEHFVRQFNPELRLSGEALRLLGSYSWPGNIRELANVIRRAVVVCSGGTILPEHLSSRLLEASSASFTLGSGCTAASIPTLASPDALWAYYERNGVLDELRPDELTRLHEGLRSLEGKLLAAMQRKGIAQPSGLNLKKSEAETIRNALRQCRGNITDAARTLGIGRNTLYRKIKEFDLAGK